MNEPAPRHVKVPPRTGPLALARAVVTAHALAVFAQPVLAGQFLDGNAGMVKVHGGVAVLIELLGMIQIPVAVLLWRPRLGTPRTTDRPAASGDPARWATAAPRLDPDVTTQRGGP
jgi:hypothetical protein